MDRGLFHSNEGVTLVRLMKKALSQKAKLSFYQFSFQLWSWGVDHGIRSCHLGWAWSEAVPPLYSKWWFGLQIRMLLGVSLWSLFYFTFSRPVLQGGDLRADPELAGGILWDAPEWAGECWDVRGSPSWTCCTQRPNHGYAEENDCIAI